VHEDEGCDVTEMLVFLINALTLALVSAWVRCLRSNRIDPLVGRARIELAIWFTHINRRIRRARERRGIQRMSRLERPEYEIS
jgi:hypothetical protein